MRSTRELTQTNTKRGVIYTNHRTGQEFDLALHPKVVEAQSLHEKRMRRAELNRQAQENKNDD